MVTHIRNNSFHSGDVVFSATLVLWMMSPEDISTVNEGFISFLFIVYAIRLYPERLAFHNPVICALMTIIDITQNIKRAM